MDKQREIRKIFSNFDCDDFFKFGSPIRSFHCDKESECGIDKKKENEPIWSPAFGDKKATVMFVAEAPSTTGGMGPHLGGLFRDWPSDSDRIKQGKIIDFIKFFTNELNYYPYFTDLVKCGPANSGDKKTIEKRAQICVELFLLKEIEIINPTHIYCVGRRSYDWLSKYKLFQSNGNRIELKFLIHYSPQAGLPLKYEDKKLIWQWQLGKLATNDIKLNQLSYFR